MSDFDFTSVETVDWPELLRLLPGYDPFAQSEGYYFDADEAFRRITFIESCCTHVEGQLAGKPFILLDWQRSYVANLLGWKHSGGPLKGFRRYRESLLYIPRKNGKTPLCAAIGLSIQAQDKEAGQQNFLAAGDKDQAKALFRHMKGMVENESELRTRCTVYKGFKSIEYGSSFTKVISADARTKHGGNSHLVLFDELHAQPNRDLYDVLVTSQASENRKQPLLVMISTADFDRPSICNEVLKRAKAVRDNPGDPSKPGFDPAFLPAIWEAEKDDDWTSEEVWARVNPSLGVAVSLGYLQRECQKARETPASENTFRRLHLNTKTEQAERYINLAKWDSCSGSIPLADLRGQRCYLGVDLSSNTDLTALVLYFPDSRAVLCFFFMPEENVRRRVEGDRVPYDVWAREGLLELTEGNTIDEEAILRRIDALAQTYEIVEAGVDRWGGRQIMNRLQGAGMIVVPIAQTAKALDAAMSEIERLYLSEQLRHGGNAILRWNAANLAVEIDHDEKVKPSKKKSFERIDGMSALANAIDRALVDREPEKSPYENWGEEEEEREAMEHRENRGVEAAPEPLMQPRRSVYETWFNDDE